MAFDAEAGATELVFDGPAVGISSTSMPNMRSSSMSRLNVRTPPYVFFDVEAAREPSTATSPVAARRSAGFVGEADFDGVRTAGSETLGASERTGELCREPDGEDAADLVS